MAGRNDQEGPEQHLPVYLWTWLVLLEGSAYSTYSDELSSNTRATEFCSQSPLGKPVGLHEGFN